MVCAIQKKEEENQRLSPRAFFGHTDTIKRRKRKNIQKSLDVLKEFHTFAV